MGKIADATFTGASGKKYSFEVYPFGTTFTAVGAVYAFTVRTVSKGKGTHSFVYIGQTGDLSERFENHHKAKCITKNNPTCICVHGDSNEKSRLDIEADLLAKNTTLCNG
jgi:hypothetical protein